MKQKVTTYADKRHLIEAFITKQDEVLDIGFVGHGDGVEPSHVNWAHRLLQEKAKTVYGLDLAYDEKLLSHPERYKRGSAESFDFGRSFDVIFAGDIIEHLANPGLFLATAKRHLKPGGKLIITTPNTFNVFNIAEKFSKIEPSVNAEHTMYFNLRTLRNLVKKDWDIQNRGYIYRLDMKHHESWKKRVLNFFYWLTSQFTPKFMETMFMVLTEKRA